MAIIKAILKQTGYVCGSLALAFICMMLVMVSGLLLGFDTVGVRNLSLYVTLFTFVGFLAYFNFSPNMQRPQEDYKPETELPEMNFDLIRASSGRDSSPIFQEDRPRPEAKQQFVRELDLGFFSGKKLLIENGFLSFRDVYSQNFTVQANKITTVSVSPASWGYGFLIIVGQGSELARVKLPLPWAENCMKWILTELNL